MKNILFVSGTYIAALIGAGLASGAETAAFFARYGKFGFLGVILCSCIFGIFIYALICGCNKFNTYTVTEYGVAVGGKAVSAIFQICIVIFLMCVYSAMIAGAGEIAVYIYEEKKLITAVVFNLICILIILMPIEKILNLCGVLGMFLGLLIIYSAVHIAQNRGIQTFNPTDNWAVSSISYSGYNILSSFGIICPLSKFIKSRKQAAAVGIISGTAIFFVLACLWGAISIYHGKIELGVMPMLTLAKRQGRNFFCFYVWVLAAAIFTTAVSSAYGIYSSVSDSASKFKAAVAVFSVSMLISFMGFGDIVNKVYRICGIVGIIVPVVVIKQFFSYSDRKTNKNYMYLNEKKRK